MEFFLGAALKDEVMKIMPVQKQTRAGQRTRFKVRCAPATCVSACAHAVVGGQWVGLSPSTSWVFAKCAAVVLGLCTARSCDVNNMICAGVRRSG